MVLFAGANDSPEQIAFNHFASEIIVKNYPDTKAIYFPGQTESEKSMAGPFARCFGSDADFSQFYYQQKKTSSEKLAIESEFPNLQKSSKIKSKQLNLKIYRAVTKGEIDYVYIKVFKEKHFTDHYLIKISSGKVVDVCLMNEVI
jgi:5,10-methylene-tetrahydrofolate dehydrogenase/methenyl tetrahydrofolate cyclohydrolase